MPSQSLSQNSLLHNTYPAQDIDDEPTAKMPRRESAIFNIPAYSDLFKQSRRVELQKIDNVVSNLESDSTPIIVVTGMGGIGKSQLLRKYARDNRALFVGRCRWFNASSILQLEKEFRALAKKLGCFETYLPLLIGKVYDALQEEKTLLVFDNAADYQTIKQFLPNSNIEPDKLLILISSRNPKGWETLPTLELSPGDESIQQDSINYIKTNTDCTEKDASDLAIKLGFLPLAVAQAVKYINKVKIDITGYLTLYEQEKAQLLNEQVHTRDDYQETVLTTWALAFKELEKQNNQAAELLNASSYLASEAIPRDILCGYFTNNSLLQNNSLIEDLLAFSLIEATSEHFTVHCMIQEVIHRARASKSSLAQ